jgi:hypothetical protein
MGSFIKSPYLSLLEYKDRAEKLALEKDSPTYKEEKKNRKMKLKQMSRTERKEFKKEGKSKQLALINSIISTGRNESTSYYSSVLKKTLGMTIVFIISLFAGIGLSLLTRYVKNVNVYLIVGSILSFFIIIITSTNSRNAIHYNKTIKKRTVFYSIMNGLFAGLTGGLASNYVGGFPIMATYTITAIFTAFLIYNIKVKTNETNLLGKLLFVLIVSMIIDTIFVLIHIFAFGFQMPHIAVLIIFGVITLLSMPFLMFTEFSQVKKYILIHYSKRDMEESYLVYCLIFTLTWVWVEILLIFLASIITQDAPGF